MTRTRRQGHQGAAPPTRAGGRWPWWVAAITFVVGLVVGVIAVGLLSSGKPDFPTVAGSPDTRTSPFPTTAGASAEVNASCLEVINEAQELYNILNGVGEAAADVDLQRLDDIVRQLQPIQPRLQRDLQNCNVNTGVGSEPGTSAPTPTPTVPQTTPTR